MAQPLPPLQYLVYPHPLQRKENHVTYLTLKIALLAVLLIGYALLHYYNERRLLRRVVDEFGMILAVNRSQHQVINEQSELLDAMLEQVLYLRSECNLNDVEQFSAKMMQVHDGELPRLKGYVPYTLARCPFSDN